MSRRVNVRSDRGRSAASTKRPPILYRYMTAAHGLSLLRDPWLKITPPINFNDPYELTPRASRRHNSQLARLILEDEGGRQGVANILNERLRTLLKGQHFVALEQGDLPGMVRRRPKLWRAFMRDYLRATGTVFAMDFLRIASRFHGVACFSEDPLNRVMWAQYGDNARGVVVGFDSRNPFFCAVPLMRVLYRKHRTVMAHLKFGRNRPRPAKSWSRVDFLVGKDEVVRTKNVHFKHEREWRICVLLANCRKRWRGMYFRRIPCSCIKEIIIGPKCDALLQKRIAAYASRRWPKVKLNRMTLDLATYDFHQEQVADV
jgi:hypothetical protein